MQDGVHIIPAILQFESMDHTPQASWPKYSTLSTLLPPSLQGSQAASLPVGLQSHWNGHHRQTWINSLFQNTAISEKNQTCKDAGLLHSEALLLEHITTAVNYCLQLWYKQGVQVGYFARDTG